MPRYKFAWANLPPALLAALAREWGLPSKGDTADALREAYGARPGEDFVRDAWDVLRDHWLARDPVALRAVVDGLWQPGPRNGYLSPVTQKARLEWVRKRNNSPRLREVVLEQFISAGEARHAEASSAAPRVNRETAASFSRSGRGRAKPGEARSPSSTPPDHGETNGKLGEPSEPARVPLVPDKKPGNSMSGNGSAMAGGEPTVETARPRSGGSQVITGSMKNQVDKVGTPSGQAASPTP